MKNFIKMASIMMLILLMVGCSHFKPYIIWPHKERPVVQETNELEDANKKLENTPSSPPIQPPSLPEKFLENGKYRVVFINDNNIKGYNAPDVKSGVFAHFNLNDKVVIVNEKGTWLLVGILNTMKKVWIKKNNISYTVVIPRKKKPVKKVVKKPKQQPTNPDIEDEFEDLPLPSE